MAFYCAYIVHYLFMSGIVNVRAPHGKNWTSSENSWGGFALLSCQARKSMPQWMINADNTNERAIWWPASSYNTFCGQRKARLLQNLVLRHKISKSISNSWYVRIWNPVYLGHIPLCSLFLQTKMHVTYLTLLTSRKHLFLFHTLALSVKDCGFAIEIWQSS